MAQTPVRRYRFGKYELLSDQRRLLADDATVPLGSRAFDVLEALVEQAGALVGKDALMDRLWGDVAVGDNTLQVHVSALRRALGADAGAIVTEQGRGYRFTAPVLSMAPEAPARPDKPGTSFLTNLPLAATRLIGRGEDVGTVAALLESAQLVTITGPGGIGKTSLALEAGRQALSAYPDGVWLVELATLEDPALLTSTVATALGIRLSGDTSKAALAKALERRSMLLILDNCEHVIDEAAALAQILIGTAPDLRILATSREGLRCDGEQIHGLPPLALPDQQACCAAEALISPAIELFVERARAADASFRLDDANAAAVATICRRLDGIALALELAATQVPLLSIEILADRLDERFRMLIGGKRTALPRHQTLRATLDWSYDLLSEPERVLLRRLGIFSGGFTLVGAETVAADELLPEWEIIGPLTQLVAKSLLVLDRGEGHARFRLLETTRAYALEKLEASGEMPMLRRRHVAYLRAAWERLHDQRALKSEPDWLADAGYMLDDVRAALDWSFAESMIEPAVALVWTTRPLWAAKALASEGVRWTELALDRADATIPPRSMAWLWHSMASLTDNSELETPIEHARRAIAVFRSADEPLGLVLALSTAAECLVFLGRLDEAEPLLTECFSALLRKPVPVAEISACGALGTIRARRGDQDAAKSLFERALSVARTSGEIRIELLLHVNLASVAFGRGDFDEAIALCREVIRRAERTPNISALALGWANLIASLVARGDINEALSAGRESVPVLRKTGMLLPVLDYLALRAGLAGKLETAARLLGHADRAADLHLFDRQADAKSTVARLDELLRESLAAERRAALQAEGAALSEDEIVAIAFA